MEKIPRSSRLDAREPPEGKLGYREGGKGGRYDSCAGLSIQWRTTEGRLHHTEELLVRILV